MFKGIIAAFTVPITVLNWGSGVVGGIWLAFRGEWKLIIIGVVLMFTLHWILSLLMMPNLALGGLAVYLYNRKNPLGHIVGYLSQVYTNILIILTIVAAFITCTKYYPNGINFSLLPYLLWSWSMGLGPWQFFASKEPDNEFSFITLFSASCFYFLFLIGIYVSPYLVLIVLSLAVLVHLLFLPVFNLYIASKSIASSESPVMNEDIYEKII